MRNADSDEDEESRTYGEEGDRKKRKRHRIALSCIQCKRRKVKCSRTSPCEACVRHGIPDECKWEEGSGAEQSQPFAMTSDLRQLEARYRILEKYVVDKLAVNSGELASLLAQAQAPTPSSNPTSPSIQKVQQKAVVIGNWWSLKQSRKDPAEEDAAAVLEELASGPSTGQELARRTSAYNKKPATAQTTIMLSQPLDESEILNFLPFHELLDRLYSSLPSDEVITALIYANDSQIFYRGAFHQPTIIAEMQEFLLARRNNDLDQIDPAWLALFLSLLCSGLSDTDDRQSHIGGRPRRELVKLSPFWMSASRAALDLSGYYDQPQLRVLMTMVIYMWLDVQPISGKKKHGSIWIALAIRIAQSLGLHQLGADENTMPPDDPALPSGSSGLKRQIALRLWHQLTFLDLMATMRSPHLVVIRPEECDVGLPANVRDVDLGSAVHIEERPDDEATDGGFVKFKCRVMDSFRETRDIVNEIKDLPDQAAAQRVLELDRKFRARIEAGRKGGIPALYLPNMTSGLMNRILHLHRTFATRAYNGESQFTESMRAQLEAASAICHANRDVDEKGFLFTPRHLLSAVMCLYQHRFAMIDRDMAEQDAIETASAIDLAAACLARFRDHKTAEVRRTSDRTLALILALREAEKQRRLRPRTEPFLQVVKRISVAKFQVSDDALRNLALSAMPGETAAYNGGLVASPQTDGSSTIFDGLSALPVLAKTGIDGMNFSPSETNMASATSTLADSNVLPTAYNLDGFGSLDVLARTDFDWAAMLQGDAPLLSASLF